MNEQYAAGLIDGEGWIGIVQAGGTFHVRMKVAMTDKGLPALNALSALFGGRVIEGREATSTTRKTYEWIRTGEDASRIISTVRPWLLVKAEVADIALEFQQLHGALEKSPRRGRIWTEEAKERAAMLRKRIKEANRRGPDPEPPTLPDATPVAVYRWGWWWEPNDSLMGPVEFSGKLPTTGRMVAGHLYAMPTPNWSTTPVSAAASVPTPTTADAGASGGSVPSNVTLTDLAVRMDFGAQQNPRHS